MAPTMSTIDSKALAEAIYSTSGVPELMQARATPARIDRTPPVALQPFWARSAADA